MAINFGASQVSSNSNYSVSPLEQQIAQAVADNCLVIRLNIGANDWFSSARPGAERAQTSTPLVTNKGSLMFNAKGETFCRTAQHGIIVWNPGKRSWDLPPASIKQADGSEQPATGEKASGISAILIHALKVSLLNAGMQTEAQSLTLNHVWAEEFNFDLPISKEDLLALRSDCAAERTGGNKKLTRSIVLAVRLLCDVDGDNNFTFKIKPVALLSDNQPVMQLKFGSAITLTVDFYQQAFDAAEQEETADQSEQLGQAALNFLANGGSRNSKRNANKKARKKAEAEALKLSNSVDTATSVEASVEMAEIQQPEAEIEDIPMNPGDIADLCI